MRATSTAPLSSAAWTIYSIIRTRTAPGKSSGSPEPDSPVFSICATTTIGTTSRSGRWRSTTPSRPERPRMALPTRSLPAAASPIWRFSTRLKPRSDIQNPPARVRPPPRFYAFIRFAAAQRTPKNRGGLMEQAEFLQLSTGGVREGGLRISERRFNAVQTSPPVNERSASQQSPVNRAGYLENVATFLCRQPDGDAATL